jgi:hypothetical protein
VNTTKDAEHEGKYKAFTKQAAIFICLLRPFSNIIKKDSSFNIPNVIFTLQRFKFSTGENKLEVIQEKANSKLTSLPSGLQLTA